jgi:hypothetical protein
MTMFLNQIHVRTETFEHNSDGDQSAVGLAHASAEKKCTGTEMMQLIYTIYFSLTS